MDETEPERNASDLLKGHDGGEDNKSQLQGSSHGYEVRPSQAQLVLVGESNVGGASIYRGQLTTAVAWPGRSESVQAPLS